MKIQSSSKHSRIWPTRRYGNVHPGAPDVKTVAFLRNCQFAKGSKLLNFTLDQPDVSSLSLLLQDTVDRVMSRCQDFCHI